MQTQLYRLFNFKRQLDYPFKLYEVGWMPHHKIIHRDTRINLIYFCLSFNEQFGSIYEFNQNLQVNHGDISFMIFFPGMILKSLKSPIHDEIFFSYDPSLSDDFEHFLHINSHRVITPVMNNAIKNDILELRRLLDNLHASGNIDRLDQLAIKLITEIMFSTEEKSEEKLSMNLKIHEIAAKLSSGYPLSVLLPKYSLSYRTFYREWDKIFTDTPVQFVTNKKMAEAEQLLLKNTASIDEIVEHCHFSSKSYFHQVFKKKHGCTPKEYRNSFSLEKSREHLHL